MAQLDDSYQPPRAGGLFERLVAKLLSLVWSRRSYAILYALGMYLLRDQLGMDEVQAAEIVASILAWVLSDSIKPTGGFLPQEPKDKLAALAGSVRFWMLVACQMASLLAPGPTTTAFVASLSTIILGRGLRRTA